MEYNNLTELYRALLPAFRVKQRLLGISLYKNVTNEDIWQYLAITKWKISRGLTIADMVNDVIMIDAKDIMDYKGEKQ